MQQALAARTNSGPFGGPWWAWLIASVVYVLSPIDLLPEFPLGCIGVLDDLGIAAFGILCFVRMLTGWFATPVPAVAHSVRSVTVEPVRPPTGEPRMITARPARQIPAAPAPIARNAAIFIVQVLDVDGLEQRVEVEARDAEHAREMVTALGADGQIGKVWLKRMVGTATGELGGDGVQ